MPQCEVVLTKRNVQLLTEVASGAPRVIFGRDFDMLIDNDTQPYKRALLSFSPDILRGTTMIMCSASGLPHVSSWAPIKPFLKPIFLLMP